MCIYVIYHVVLHADFMYYVLCQKLRIKHVQSINRYFFVVSLAKL